MYVGQVSSQVSVSPRQELSSRQAETVERLLAAGAEELRAVGHEALTIRTVAHRAEVSPATAYTYLASKHHLFAELFLRHVTEIPHHPSRSANPLTRLVAAVRQLTERLAAFPELAAAVTPALLGTDPNVERLRVRIGAEFVGRFADALGDDADPVLLDTLMLTFTGALLQSGIGITPYSDLGDRLDGALAVILRGNT